MAATGAHPLYVRSLAHHLLVSTDDVSTFVFLELVRVFFQSNETNDLRSTAVVNSNGLRQIDSDFAEILALAEFAAATRVAQGMAHVNLVEPGVLRQSLELEVAE